jgi:dihydrofolate reductase
MRRLLVFNNITLDGFIGDAKGDMSWAHNQDAEWTDFVTSNAQGGGEFVFGRITYELMASFWPTPMAIESMPVVANRMNGSPKYVFSTTLRQAAWSNTRLFQGDLAGNIARLKAENGPDLVIFGSGSIVSQLTQARLIDEYQFVMHPIVLGAGKSQFAGLGELVKLKLLKTRIFKNGNLLACYAPAE